MSTPVSTCSLTPKNRLVTNFHPNIWGDQFATYTPHEDKIIRACKEAQVKVLKKEVRRKSLVAVAVSIGSTYKLRQKIQRNSYDFHGVQETNMSTPVSACYLPPENRPIAKFAPNIWGDQFTTYIPEDKVTRACKEAQVEDLKKEVRRKLLMAAAAAASPGCTSQLLNFIDAVQRLGVAYHFEVEIEEALQQIYDRFHEANDIMDGDLYDTALLFRLLRQQGYNISCGIFEKFKDEKGGFKEALITDVKGLLGLYEAAHLRVHGEDILEEALAFTTTHLKATVQHLEYPLGAMVGHALKRPIRKSLEKLEARWYISIYQHEASRDDALLKLAKLDFNLVQSLHREELSNLSRWRKDLDFARKLPFTRDRLVECYTCMVGTYFEPQYSCARRILFKVMSFVSAIDDIYDAYGTPEELKSFTEAIERWDTDIQKIDHLPDYMKVCYVELLNLYKEIEEELEKEERQYRVHYAKEELKNQVRAYYSEAKWFQEGHIPTMEEYMGVAQVTAGCTLFTILSLLGMGDVVTKETFEWEAGGPVIISSLNLLGRLIDDIREHKFEQKTGHAASAVECYMKQYGVRDEEQAYEELYKRIENAWLDINQECLKPTAVPMPVLTRAVNLSRVLDVLYEDGDGYTNVGKSIQDVIRSLFIDPIV